MTDRNGGGLLPPRPGGMQTPDKKVPIVVYINGQPVTMDKLEALGAMAQIVQILTYLELDAESGKEKNK